MMELVYAYLILLTLTTSLILFKFIKFLIKERMK